MRQTGEKNSRYVSTETNRYGETRPNRNDSARPSQYGSTRSRRHSATLLNYNDDEELSQFSDIKPIRIDKTNSKRKRKRKRHWLEKVTIALAAITASVVVVLGGMIAVSVLIGSNEPNTHVAAHIQDDNSSSSESIYSYVNDNEIQNESYGEGSNSGDEVVDVETALSVLIEPEITNNTDELVVDDVTADYSTVDISDGDNAAVNADDIDENYSQTEEEIERSGGSVQHLISVDQVNRFRQFNFFIEPKLDEYVAFHLANPYLSYEYVVWKVNAGLNHDFFENIYTITDTHPFLVNPFNRLPYDFSPQGLQRIDGTDNLATPETIRAFNSFKEYARTHGHDLQVASAYRSISAQRILYANRGHMGTIARPGHSEHHTGRAIDLWGPLGLLDRWQRYPTSETALWVADYAYRFGFIVRYTIANDHITGIVGEPWHITYVTEYVSRTMRNNGYGSLEEFVARNPSFVFRP